MAESFLMEEDRHSWPLNCFVLDLLSFILTTNYFVFMDQLYLQVRDVAMNTCCAPSNANLYFLGMGDGMGEGGFLQQHTCALAPLHPVLV